MLMLPVYGELDVASFNFANHCMCPYDLSEGQNFIPLNALPVYEKKRLSQTPLSFSKPRTMRGKQRMFVSLLCLWGVKVKEASLRG